MTELEIMKNAEACLRLLVKGIDPFTKEPVPENDVVRKKEISKYLNFTADILHKTLSEQQKVSADSETPDFEIMDEGVLISQISEYLNYKLNRPEESQFTAKSLIFWLIEQGLISSEDSSHKTVTQAGASIGISQAISEKGSKVLLYSPDAQQYIYQHVNEFISYFEQHEDEFIDRRPLFFLTAEQKASLRPLNDTEKISDITKYLNSVIDKNQVRPLPNGIITNWLLSQKLMYENDKGTKFAAPEGKKVGFQNHKVMVRGEERTRALYTSEAQQYIFDHIDDLIEFNQLES